MPEANVVATPLTVVCAADAAYAMPLAAMLRSVDAHLAPGEPLRVFAIDDGLSGGARERVARTLTPRVELLWLPAQWPAAARLPISGRMPRTTYQKILLGETLPSEVTRAVWLDCDLLVTTDLRALWRVPFGESLLLAVQDRRVPTVDSADGVTAHRELGLEAGAPYFNAGVLSIDLAGWRAASVADRALDYLRRQGRHIVFHDQEALNAVLAGRWRPLDERWNIDPTLEAMLADAPETRSAGGQAGAPWIVHFTGRLKPWTYGPMSPSHALFFRHLDATAWAGWRPRTTWIRRQLARYALSRPRRALHRFEAPALAAWRALTGGSRSGG